MRLYRIAPEEIEATIQDPDVAGKEGRYHTAHKTFPGRFGSLPLKVILCGGRRTRGDFRVSIEASSLEEKKVKVRYDKKVDAAYIRFSSKRPVGGVEIKEGVILHVTDKDEIVGLEILDASERVPLKTLFTLEVLKSAT